MSMAPAPIEIVGSRGEYLFRRFADHEGIPYLWIDQRRETLPEYLKALDRNEQRSGKRPDAVASSVYGDVVLVDVKHRRLYESSDDRYFTLDKKDAERLLTTEKLLGKGVLLVYKDNADQCAEWYGQFLSNALEDAATEETRGYYKLRADRFQPLTDFLETGRFATAQLQRALF